MSQLKIVSWNIWGGKNLPEIIDCLKKENPDVIGLQEVLQDEGGGNNHAKTIAEALGYTYVYETTTLLLPLISHLLKELDIEKNMEWGNAILSKYKITDHNVHVLSDSRKRVALEATIKFENKDLHFFSTHLVYAPIQPNEVQAVQAENLLKILPKENAIVVGDFNATPDSEVIQHVNKVMLDTESDSTKFTSEGKKIDYIFSTTDIKTISSGTIVSQASDHLPVYSIIEM
jgi:endonuclease/exonuclease/phosphatase family metal-dependent hydrolase